MSDELRDAYQARTEGYLPGLFGLELITVEHGLVEGRIDLRSEFMAPNDFLHAGTVVTLADSCCGLGSMASLTEGAAGFTTIELKTNFVATATEGALRCVADLVHGGGRTQVWDAQVRREADDRVIALFRCTQFLLPREDPRTKRQRTQTEVLQTAKNEGGG